MTTKKPRPQSLPGVTFEMQTQCGKIYVTITRDAEGKPFEIFARFGKAGGCGAAIFDGLTKILSYALRSGMEPKNIISAFSGISCHLGGNTCLNAVAEAFNMFHHDSNCV